MNVALTEAKAAQRMKEEAEAIATSDRSAVQRDERNKTQKELVYTCFILFCSFGQLPQV